MSLTERLMKNGEIRGPRKPPAIPLLRLVFVCVCVCVCVCVFACMLECTRASHQVAATDAGVPAIS